MGKTRIAMCIKDLDVDQRSITIHPYATFVVEKEYEDRLILNGYWKGSTDSISELDTYNCVNVKDHFVFYDLDDNCVTCKYRHWDEHETYCTGGHICIEEGWFDNEDDEEQE